MVVFIGNLPKSAVEKDLCQQADLPTGTAVRIVKKKSRTGEMLRFALVPVNGDKRAHRLIRRIQGLNWLGQSLIAREYQPRSGAHERRRVDWRSQAWIGVERRNSERRGAVAQSASSVA